MIDSCPEILKIGPRGARTVYTRTADFVAKPRGAVRAVDEVVLDDKQLPGVVVRTIGDAQDDEPAARVPHRRK